MIINNAKFVASSEKLSQCPAAVVDGKEAVEVAFIGRSNVGKSSLINSITGHGSLAKVSSTPGKTRLVNHFLIDNRWFLVDLPGYGYARAGKSMRESFSKLIKAYILGRQELHCLFVLVDIRHEPQKIDLEFFEFLGEGGVPFAIVFTKGDKLSPTARGRNVDIYKKVLNETWEELPAIFITSAQTGLGTEELFEYIEKML